MAGLMLYYDRGDYYYLGVVNDDDLKPWLSIFQSDKSQDREYAEARVSVAGMEKLYLRGCMQGAELRFSWSKDGKNWQQIGPVMESWKISDGYGLGGFTGAFWTIGCQDMSGEFAPAYFDYFDYREV